MEVVFVFSVRFQSICTDVLVMKSGFIFNLANKLLSVLGSLKYYAAFSIHWYFVSLILLSNENLSAIQVMLPIVFY